MAEAGTFRRQRRRLLAGGLAFAALAVMPAARAAARSLRFRHLHTGERLEVEYYQGGRYQSDALAEIDRLLRDHRTGEVHPIDPALLDLLDDLRTAAGPAGTFEVISGFRSATTNEMLRRSTGGVARRSLHMDGKAIDVRLTGVATADLRRAARAAAAGGVGYYPASDFVHLDTGRVRSW